VEQAAELIIDPRLKFQIHCRIVRMKSERGSTDFPVVGQCYCRIFQG